MTTGTYNESFDNADLIAEAFERIGKDPDSLVARHINSALRSISFMMADWETKGVKEWKIEKFTISSADGFTTGSTSVTLNPRVIRVITAVHRHAGLDTALKQIGRSDYEYLADKDELGTRPDRFFVDRQRAAPVMYLWPAIDNPNDSIIINAFVHTQDVGGLSDSPDAPRLWLEAFASGLTARLAEKYAPDMHADKLILAERAWKTARGEDRDPAPTRMRVRLGRARR